MIRTFANPSLMLISLLALGVVSFAADAIEHDYLDSLELLQLLHNRQYDELETRLADVQIRYENGEESDIVVMLAFDALANSDPAHEALLNEWVESMPDSLVALASRGIYFVDLGWSHRGSDYARDTSDEQFRQMQGYHAHALEDLQRVLDMNPKFIVGYAEIISLAKATSNDELLRETVRQALEVDPRSYSVRKARFFSLMPRWGGSYQEIEEFIEDTRKYVGENPDLRPLLGFADYVRALNVNGRSKYQQAVNHYTKALEHGEKAWYYRARGTAYYRMDDYENALKDLTRALELWPQYPEALTWRGTVYEAIERYDQALADLSLSARLKPYDYRTQKHLGLVLGRKDRNEEAVAAFDAALYYRKQSGYMWRKKAWYLAFKLERPEEAAAAYKMAAQLSPDRAVYWYDYGYVLNKLHDCEVVPVLRTFVNACGDSTEGRCDERHKDWAEKVVARAIAQTSCPDKTAYPINGKKKRMAAKRPNRELTAWELYKLYVRGIIWVFLEWLGIPR